MIKLEDKPNVQAPSSSYAYGNIIDDTGTENGTPLNQLVHADFHQFFAKMFDASVASNLIASNGLPENDDNGYQYYSSLLMNARAANKTLISVLAESIIGNNLGVPLSTTVPYALMGLTDSGSAIATGYIYYNGTVYRCFGLAYGVVSHTLEFNITMSGGHVVENLLTLTDTPSSGLFAYGDLVFVNSIPKLVIAEASGETATGSSAIFKFATETSDVQGWYDPTNGKFNPKINGFYELNVKALITIAASLSTFGVEIDLYKNGTLFKSLHNEFLYPGSNGTANCDGHYIVIANGSTDYYEVRMGLSSSQTWSMTGCVTWKYLTNR